MGYDHRHRKHGDEFSAFFHRTGGTKNDTERFGFHFVGLYTYTYIKTYIHFRRRKRIKETVRLITAILIQNIYTTATINTSSDGGMVRWMVDDREQYLCLVRISSF